MGIFRSGWWILAGIWLACCWLCVCLLRSCGDAVMQRNSWSREHTSCCLLVLDSAGGSEVTDRPMDCVWMWMPGIARP